MRDFLYILLLLELLPLSWVLLGTETILLLLDGLQRDHGQFQSGHVQDDHGHAQHDHVLVMNGHGHVQNDHGHVQSDHGHLQMVEQP